MKQKSSLQWFRDISISKKLYFAVGVMALLIAMELFTLFFSIRTLSSVRALVGAEGLWSKAQKDAIYNLRKYTRSGREEDYQQYLYFLKVPLGDRVARIELTKANPDLDIIRKGFLDGSNHPDDIEGMIKLIRRFHFISYIHNAISIWTQGDSLLAQMQQSVEELHSVVSVSGISSPEKMQQNLNQIDEYNKKLTVLEDQFSATLGAGSRWLENLILNILLSIALTVEISGLVLSFSISRNITKGIKEIINISDSVAKGNFKNKAAIYSKDEIGKLASSFNKMIDDLGKNIEELHLAEKQIRESEQQIQTIFSNAPAAIIVINEDGKIVQWNPQAEIIFRWTGEEVLGKPLHEIIIPERFREAHQKGMKHFMKTGEAKVLNKLIELPALRKDNAEIEIALSISPTKINDKHFFISIINDVTYRKKAEELINSNKELEQFAYIASHDLQEPLRTISNYVGLFRDQYKGKLDENSDVYLDFINGATLRMQLLIKDLLEYSRIGHDKNVEEVNCNTLLQEVLDELAVAVEESNTIIHAEPLPVVNGYTELKSVFQNLISNAIKYRKRDVQMKINISAEAKNNEWLFAIKDNGIGIDKIYHDRIFIIFQKLHNQKQYAGTGIGLSHCKKIVELHGGKIWVESESQKGSAFYFTIPRTNAS